MKQKHIQFILSFFILLLLSACGPQQPGDEALQQNQLPVIQQSTTTEPLVESETTPNNNGYPVGDAADNLAPYPAPDQTGLTTAEQNQILEIPNPSANNATVSGIILDITTQQAPAESDLYLGLMQQTDKGLPVVTLDREQAPVTTPIKNGQFVFAEVPPGTYGIILFNPDSSFLLDDPQNSGQSMVLTVEAGQNIDLGILEITLP